MDQNTNDKERAPLEAKDLSRFSFFLTGGTAIMLLLIYIGAAIVLIVMAFDESATSGSPQGITAVYTTIGGLISALIVAIFTASRPGERFGEALIPKEEAFKVEYKNPESKIDYEDNEIEEFEKKQRRKLRADAEKYAFWLINAYIVFWILGGAGALIVGVMWKPDSISVLRDTGNAWLGIAVAAVAAYFGINPQPPEP